MPPECISSSEWSSSPAGQPGVGALIPTLPDGTIAAREAGGRRRAALNLTAPTIWTPIPDLPSQVEQTGAAIANQGGDHELTTGTISAMA